MLVGCRGALRFSYHHTEPHVPILYVKVKAKLAGCSFTPGRLQSSIIVVITVDNLKSACITIL